MLGKESISDFFPVPPAHHRVTKCDTAREKLLGIIGDLFEVSLALEENIVPEYLTSRSLKLVLLSPSRNKYLELFILFGLSRNGLSVTNELSNKATDSPKRRLSDNRLTTAEGSAVVL